MADHGSILRSQKAQIFGTSESSNSCLSWDLKNSRVFLDPSFCTESCLRVNGPTFSSKSQMSKSIYIIWNIHAALQLLSYTKSSIMFNSILWWSMHSNTFSKRIQIKLSNPSNVSISFRFHDSSCFQPIPAACCPFFSTVLVGTRYRASLVSPAQLQFSRRLVHCEEAQYVVLALPSKSSLTNPVYNMITKHYAEKKVAEYLRTELLLFKTYVHNHI